MCVVVLSVISARMLTALSDREDLEVHELDVSRYAPSVIYPRITRRPQRIIRASKVKGTRHGGHYRNLENAREYFVKNEVTVNSTLIRMAIEDPNSMPLDTGVLTRVDEVVLELVRERKMRLCVEVRQDSVSTFSALS